MPPYIPDEIIHLYILHRDQPWPAAELLGFSSISHNIRWYLTRNWIRLNTKGRKNTYVLTDYALGRIQGQYILTDPKKLYQLRVIDQESIASISRIVRRSPRLVRIYCTAYNIPKPPWTREVNIK